MTDDDLQDSLPPDPPVPDPPQPPDPSPAMAMPTEVICTSGQGSSAGFARLAEIAASEGSAEPPPDLPSE